MAVKFNQNLFNVGQRIREIRVRKGISQTELALTMGTTKTAVSYWENGERALRLDSFLKLARSLDVPQPCFLRTMLKMTQKAMTFFRRSPYPD